MKNAGVLYQSEFKSSAHSATSYLKLKRFKVISMPFKNPSTLANLPRFPDKLDFMVWYSHGGWDGPLVLVDENMTSGSSLPLQISPTEPEEWVQLMTYFKFQLNPNGIFIAHSCHAAGSDWREKSRDRKLGLSEEDRVWVRDIAKHMNVYAFGQAGSAGAANIPTVKLLLEFALTGKAKGYPFKAYAPGGVRMKRQSEWPKL